ncbi:threonine dehydratase [Congregibacter brevis]|uniref:Threonine dehydratase n=1 Tax=Congregibacter brevis TaxID=3081201 RepID=A0ABZ0IAC4_9GAMM|nr:threonine dehydratase [Congregibacter sp. IMCC45268]
MPDNTTSLASLKAAATRVYAAMPATPQYAWPMLAAELGAELWVKHENHTPAGAFKVRGGITFIDWLRETHPECRGIATATRGNHGQSQARAAAAAGLEATIVVPHGNAREKNDAMRGFGAKLIEHGKDFDESREKAKRLAALEDLYLVPPFHQALVSGVASYALELFSAVPHIKRVYVPIGCGSGICAVIAARDAMGLDTEVIGVVSTEATAAQQAFLSGKPETTASARTFADGVAVRSVVPEALAIYREGAQRVIAVSDDEIAHAMRLYFRCTHNVSEGAGAAPLAAAIREKDINAGERIAVILCGGNVDTEVFQEVLSGRTPQA